MLILFLHFNLAARESTGSVGNRSGSEDNQSDTETGSRGQPSVAETLESTNDGNATQQGKLAM